MCDSSEISFQAENFEQIQPIPIFSQSMTLINGDY